MFAWSLSKPGLIEEEPLDLVEAPDPEPGRGEIRIRVTVCALAERDVALVTGRVAPPAYPVVPGHALVGEVQRVGRGVERFSVGERVAVSGLLGVCGKCPDCTRGDENLCPEARHTGLHSDGGLAELIVVREDFAFPLGTVGDEVGAAVLGTGLPAIRGLRRALAGVWENVGLYGGCPGSETARRILSHRGCRVFELEGSETPPAVLDRALVFAADSELVGRALAAVRRGGKVAVVAGIEGRLPGLDFAECLAGEKVLTTATGHTREDVAELLRLAAEIPLEPEYAIHPFRHVHSALAEAAADPPTAVLVRIAG